MNPVIRVLLHAGLGNQMFMYAAGRSLALRTGGTLVLDVARFPRDRIYRREYGLARFPIRAKTIRNDGLYRFFPERVASKAERVIRRHASSRAFFGVIDEQHNGAAIFSPPSKSSLILDGYWQSERYFAEHSEQIRAELTPPRPADPVSQASLAAIEAASLPVAVCIRFYCDVPGMFVDHKAILATYREALLSHQSRYPLAEYFLFTEESRFFTDPTCLGVPFHELRYGPHTEDKLYGLSRCADFFISFSSYHWWGAWLAPIPNKRVFYLPLDRVAPPHYVPDAWATVKPGTTSWL